MADIVRFLLDYKLFEGPACIFIFGSLLCLEGGRHRLTSYWIDLNSFYYENHFWASQESDSIWKIYSSMLFFYYVWFSFPLGSTYVWKHKCIFVEIMDCDKESSLKNWVTFGKYG